MSQGRAVVVNLRKESYDVYIGRPGKGLSGVFGNPFWVGDESARSEAIAKFKVYFHEKLSSDAGFAEKVAALRGKRLGCFCSPKMCHGDVIAEYVNGLPAPEAKPSRPERLRLAEESVGDCRLCPLHEGRKNIVYGVGSASADLMFVGEGPGADEDEQGEPFVGKAGQLLDKMIEAMGLDRRYVYINNTVMCRPTSDEARSANRAPTPEEQRVCSKFLHERIEIVSPKVIVPLGGIAVRWFFPELGGIMSSRGQWRKWQDRNGREIDVMPTYHPSFCLRDPRAKAPVWKDLKAVSAKLLELT